SYLSWFALAASQGAHMNPRRSRNEARSRAPAPQSHPPADLVFVDSNGRAIRLLDDARISPGERRELEAMSRKTSLTAADRRRLEELARELPSRGSGSSRGSLLASMPRPLRPPPSRILEE